MNSISIERIRSIVGSDAAVRYYPVIDSTSSEAKRVFAEGMCGEGIFIADGQTMGRGRQGKSFFSPSGTGIYFTALLHHKGSLQDAVGITAAAAVAAADIIREATKKDPKIKWVNDIYIDGKKVCGILTEAVVNANTSAVLVGIGINLTTEDFPNELSGIAGNIGHADRNEMIGKIFLKLREFCRKLPDRSFMEDYRSYSLVLGNKIFFTKDGISYSGIAESILDDGCLQVIIDNGERMILNSGEISIKL